MLKFRNPEEGDLDAMVMLMAEFYAIDGYPFDSNKHLELLRTFMSDESLGRAWLIDQDGNTIGYAILTIVFSFEYGGKIGFIDELYLNEDSRGKGIGRRAVEKIKTEAGKLLLKVLYLEVEHHNIKAQNLYIAAGFQNHHRQLMRYLLSHH